MANVAQVQVVWRETTRPDDCTAYIAKVSMASVKASDEFGESRESCQLLMDERVTAKAYAMSRRASAVVTCPTP
jgi:hypothetical protein